MFAVTTLSPAPRSAAAPDLVQTEIPVPAPQQAPAARPQGKAKPRLTGIQRLRGAAALLVLVNHTVDQTWASAEASPLPPVAFIDNVGAIGVDLFFIISGFVMAYSIAGRTGRGAARDFLIMRWIRVAPPFLIVSMALVAVFTIQGITVSWQGLANSALFIPFFDAGTYTIAPLSVGWTLAFEFTFYVLVALVVALGVRHAAHVLMIGIVALVLIGYTLPDAPWLVQWVTNPIMLEFALGIGVYLIWKSGGFARRRALWLAGGAVGLGIIVVEVMYIGYGLVGEMGAILDGTLSLERTVVWGLPCVLVVGGVLAWGAGGGAGSRASGSVSGSGSGSASGLGSASASGSAPASASASVGTGGTGARPGATERLRRAVSGWVGRTTKALGDQSYSLYLVHIPVLMALGASLSALGAHWPPIAVFGVGIAASVAVGALYYRLVEVPLTGALRRSATVRADRRAAVATQREPAHV